MANDVNTTESSGVQPLLVSLEGLSSEIIETLREVCYCMWPGARFHSLNLQTWQDDQIEILRVSNSISQMVLLVSNNDLENIMADEEAMCTIDALYM